MVLNIFIVAHSIFFLGSISFKKYPIIFTPITFFILAIAISLYNELLEKIVLVGVELQENMPNLDFEDFFADYKTLAKILVFYVFPLVLWFASYLKLNEKEY